MANLLREGAKAANLSSNVAAIQTQNAIHACGQVLGAVGGNDDLHAGPGGALHREEKARAGGRGEAIARFIEQKQTGSGCQCAGQ